MGATFRTLMLFKQLATALFVVSLAVGCEVDGQKDLVKALEKKSPAVGPELENDKRRSEDFQLAIAGGNFQLVETNLEFEPLRIVLSKAGQPMQGEPIQWSVMGPNGSNVSVNAQESITNEDGEASIVAYSGSYPGTISITALHLPSGHNASFMLFVESLAKEVQLEAVSGNFQTGGLMTIYNQPLRVQLTKSGAPMVGEVIDFQLDSGSGSLSAAQVTTDKNGLAQVTYTSGSVFGNHTVMASWNGGTKMAIFLLRVENTSASKVVKITEAGPGQQEVIASGNMVVGAARTIKAALYDQNSGEYLQDVAVNWSAVGGGFNSNDFQGSTANSTTVVFAPTRTGSTSIQATYSGPDTNVVGVVATTGTFTVSMSNHPSLMTIVSGNNQNGVVGSNLPTPLKVKVTDGNGDPVQGVGVLFSNTQGGGQVSPATVVLTDADGEASVAATLGTINMANIFHAKVMANDQINVDFHATSVAGAAHTLMFSTQPGNAMRFTAFGQQPTVTVRDQYNNLVTTGSYVVTIAREAGTGNLSGTTSVTTVNGVASFSGLTLDAEENHVTLRATSTPTLLSATSQAFDVGPPWPGACIQESANFVTADGGCQHVPTGLVWSAPSVIGMTWYDAVWDLFGTGNANTQLASDRDRTNDYRPGVGCSGSCDNSDVNYCHDLDEGGYSDWRLPTFNELSDVAGSAGAATHFSGNLNRNFWSSTQGSSSSNACTMSMLDRTESCSHSRTIKNNNQNGVICVRGSSRGMLAGGAIALDTAIDPECLVQNEATYGSDLCRLTLRLKDSLGHNLNAQGVTMTLTADSGAVVGNTAVTNNAGVAVFDNLMFTDFGTITVTATAPTMNPFSFNVDVKPAGSPKGCRSNPPPGWITAQGGCKNIAMNIVYSYMAPSAMTWHDAIWQEVRGAPYDPDDYLLTHEFENDPGDGGDGSGMNYCHDLDEGGYTDWRMPRMGELNVASVDSSSERPFLFPTDVSFWSARTTSNSGRACRIGNLNGASVECRADHQNANKGHLYNVICVRDP